MNLADIFPLKGSNNGKAAPRPVALGKKGRGSRRAAASRMRAVNFETLEPRILLSADPLQTGYTAALTEGLTAFGSAIELQLEDDAFANDYVPGILLSPGASATSAEFSPTLEEALRLNTDVSANLDPYITPFSIPGVNASLSDRFAYTPAPQFNFTEFRLAALDIDGDRFVTLDEAFKVLVVGQIQHYLANNAIVDQNGDDAVDASDLGRQLLRFIWGTLGDDQPAFGVPSTLSNYFSINISDSFGDTFDSYDSNTGTLLWNLDLSLSMISEERLDLGYEADELNIALSPPPAGSSIDSGKRVEFHRTLDLNDFQFGFRGADDGVLAADDFFFALPDGYAISVGFDTPDTFVFNGPPGYLPGTLINIGFLGAGVTAGEMNLNMAVKGTASDPSNPKALGFTVDQQGVVQADGTLLAGEAPDTILPSTGIEFALKIGSTGDPVTINLAGGDYGSVAGVAIALQGAINAALGPSVVSVNVVGDKLQLDLADASPELTTVLGFTPGQSGTGSLLSSNLLALIGTAPPADPIEFWLSINGAVPVAISVTVQGSPNGPDNDPDTADDNNTITLGSLSASLNQAIADAGLNLILQAVAVPASSQVRLQLIGAASGLSLELPASLRLDNIDQITLAELQAPGNEIFEQAADVAGSSFLADLQVKALPGLELENSTTAYLPEGRIYSDARPFTSEIGSVVVSDGAQRKAIFTLTDGPNGTALTSGESDTQTLLDFNVISVADILGIVGEIANYLERLSATELLQVFDIPFAQDTLGNVLDFKKMIVDALFLDDYFNRSKPTNGFAGLDESAASAKLLQWFPTSGALDDWVLRPRFSTAQNLETILQQIMPGVTIDASVRQYAVDGQDRQDLLYNLSFGGGLTPNGDPVIVPLDFDLDLAPLGDFVTSGALALNADGSMGFTLGIKLGNAAAALNIDGNGAATDLKDDLNSGNGVRTNNNIALTSLGEITPIVGRLSNNASFTLTLYGAGDPETVVVTVSKAATADNRVLQDLINDLNAALTAQGVGSRIQADTLSEVIDGVVSDRIVLRAIDPTLVAFDVVVANGNTAFTELGLQTQRAATVSVLAPAPVTSVTPNGLSFTLNVFRANGSNTGAISVSVPSGALSDNQTIANLVTDINQVLAAALTANGLASDAIVVSQSNGRLAFSALRSDIIGFWVNPVTNGTDVGLGSETLVASVFVRGSTLPENLFGRLSADVTVEINGTAVLIEAADTTRNASIDDLIDDINAAIDTAGLLGTQVKAFNEGFRIVFRSVDPELGSLSLSFGSAEQGAALGFAVSASSIGTAVRPELNVISSLAAPVSYGVSSDATFSVTIERGAATETRNVTLRADDTIVNRNLFDLAASLTNALNSAFFGAANNPLVVAVQAGRLVMGLRTSSVGSNLIGQASGAAIGVTGFSIGATVSPSVTTDLKLAAGASASNTDFIIRFADGSQANIQLDGGAIAGIGVDANNRLTGNLQTLVAGILAQANAGGDRLAITLGRDGSSLQLTDLTFDANAPANNVAEFSVTAINASLAALQLGILGKDSNRLNASQDAAQKAPVDGVIEGDRIAAVDLLDRVYLDDVTLTAEVDLKTVGVASATATFGFVGVKLESDSDQSLFNATLEVPFLGEETSLRDLFAALGNVQTLRTLIDLPTFELNGPQAFALKVSVLEPIAGLATALDIPNDAKIEFILNSLGALTDVVRDSNLVPGGIPGVGLTGAPSVTVNFDSAGFDIGDLASFGELSFQKVIDALRAVSNVLNTFAAFEFLNDDIPGLGVSFNELLTIADKFAKAVDEIQKNPSGGLQQLAQKLREGFGLPDFADDTERAAFFNALGIPDPTDLILFALDVAGSDKLLRFDLRLPVGFSRSMQIDLGLGDVDFLNGAVPVELKGGAGLAASGYLDARLSFGIDLDSGEIFVYDDVTGIFGGLAANGDRLTFNAAVGPLGIFVKDGRFNLGVNFSVSNDGAGDRQLIGDFLTGLTAQLSGEASATLPVYFPTDSRFIGDLALDLTGVNGLSLDANGLQIPDFSVPGVLTLPDFSSIDLSDFSVLDSIPLMLDALDFFLQGLQDILDGEIAGFELPLIGDQLAGGVDFIEDLRRDILSPIRTYVEQAPELGLDFVQALLYELLGDASAQGKVGGVDIEDLIGLGSDIQGIGLLKAYTTGATAPGMISQGDIVAFFDEDLNDFSWKFRLGQTYSPNIDFGFDIGIPALSLEADVGLDVEISWDLALGLGLSIADGAYIFIGNHRTPATTDDEELVVEINVELREGSNISGTLGFLQLIISESNATDTLLEHGGTFVNAKLGFDLINKSDLDDEKLSFSELGNLGVKVSLEAEAEVNLDLVAQFDKDVVGDAVAAVVPSVSARFILDWETGNILGSDFDFANSLKTLGFRDVSIDMGSFINDFLGPFVGKVAEVTEPLQPIIDVITAPIPVISELSGQPVSLVDLAGMTGYVDPGLIYAVADIITLVNRIGSASNNGSISIPIGDFILIDVPEQGGSSQSSLPDSLNFNANELLSAGYSFDKTFTDQNGKSILDGAGFLANDILDGLNSAGSLTPQQQNTKSIASSLTGPDASLSGFAFPIFDDPSLIFGFLLGQDIPIVTYDLAPFGMDFSYVQKFPIWGPLFARIGGSVGLTIDLAFGYDTAGVRQFAAGNFSNPLDLVGGFYISDTDNPNGTGTDVPELILRGELFAGAEINLGIGSAGVEGAIILTVNFDLYDPNRDGKVRLDELLGNFLYEFNYGSPLLAPVAIFDVFGDVSAQLRAFVELLFFSETFNITPPITLFEFTIPFEREPILATERGDGSLLLNIGPNAASRLNGDTRDIGESIFVKSVEGSNNEVLVWGMGINEGDAQKYRLGANKLIVAYGGAGNDLINLSGVSAASGIRYLVEGGDGDDTIYGTQAGGTMRGDAGNDRLFGGDGVDIIFGGEGNDFIRGGGGADYLFGDSGLITQVTPEGAPDGTPKVDRFRVIVGDRDGDDDIDGEGGNDIIFGGGGRDVLRGGDGNDLIFGDGGSFDMAIGNVLPTVNGRVDMSRFNVRGAGGDDVIFGGAGNDTIFAGAGNDRVDGGAGDDQIDGGAGFDVIYGGSGADWLWGGDDDDVIFGFRDPHGAVFGFAGDVADNAPDGGDFIDGGDGNDFIRGQGGDDTIYGGRGSDIIFGDEGNDTIFGGGGADIIFGGAGDDIIDGGDGADILFGDDGLLVYFGYQPGIAVFLDTGSRIRHDAAGNRYIGDDDILLAAYYAGQADSLATSLDLIVTVPRASDGSDTVIGGNGDDIIFGGGGALDKLFGDLDPSAPASTGPRPTGQDIIIGDGGRVEWHGRRVATVEAVSSSLDGVDWISGNDGNDFLLGGGGKDKIWGFQQVGGVSIEGVTDNDIILGDNGIIRFDTTDVQNRVKSIETTYVVGDSGDNDELFGNQGNDIIFGGLGSDLIQGDAGDDILIGDQGEVRFDLTADLDVLDLVRSFADGRGGADAIFGNDGDDIIIGGTGGDILRGNDGDDIILGDNGEITLGAGPGRLMIRVAATPAASAVRTIATTDVSESTGGVDIITGDAGSDILFGGVAGDFLYGDSLTPNAARDAADVIVGDNGMMDFTLDGNLETLNLIESFTDGLGGNDTIYGHAGGDVVIGGTGADIIFGDDATGSSGNRDGDDILIGDNAELILRRVDEGETPQLSVLGSGVQRIRTTDDFNLPYWQASFNDEWVDVISGQAGGDVIIGGLAGDILYGAAETPNYALDGADVIVGDNGELDFDLDGDLGVLNLVRSYRDNLGGNDTISGHAAGDVVIGGTGADLIFGDNAGATGGAADGDDILVGDNADIELRKLEVGELAQITVRGGGVQVITTTDIVDNKGWIDTISGNAGSDIIIGGVAGDLLYGDRELPTALSNTLDGDDILLGDNGRLDFDLNGNLNSLDRIATFLDGLGGDDIITGNAGADVALGGTGDDLIYGDNPTAAAGNLDRNDILLGDNGVIELVTAPLTAPTAQGIRIFGGAVAAIYSTDDDGNAANTAGSDIIEGNAGADIILGGAMGDQLFGDRATITAASNAIDGNDIILGDNGRLEWLSDGRLGDIAGINLAATNADLWAKYSAGVADTNVDTLDLITTEQPNNGGRDLIIGGNGSDVIFGGTDSDLIFGDTAGAVAPNAISNDLIFGDHGRLYPQFSRALVGKNLVELQGINGRNFFAIDTGAADGGDGDIIFGEEGDDIILGQQGDDRLFGGTGDDDMIGGHNVIGGVDELGAAGAVSVSGQWDILLEGIDLVRGGDWNDLMDGGAGNDAMAGDNATIWRRGDTLNARFRAVDGTVLYSTTYDTIAVNVQGAGDLTDSVHWRPELGTNVGRDIELLDHSDAVEGDPLGRFGNDIMAGGAGNDTMFGQLGDDLMQGDGDLSAAANASKGLFSFVDAIATPAAWLAYPSALVTSFHFNVPERLATDGADYMEGNGGNDIMYGGLGQDDMIGGSSSLFGLVTNEQRPDGADIMFGGAGNPDRMGRNAGFDTAAQTDGDGLNRANDADFMLGDNANVFRIVNAAGTTYVRYNYDTTTYSSGIVVRGMELLDYTLGGPDYDPVSQATDRGAGDWMHGESGNDMLHGMAGSDVLFGGAHDDDLIGGYGHDWISGGTGQDGVIGDDGIILTSRNGLSEALIGLNTPNLQQFISTPGKIQTATIYPTGQLLKSVDLTPITVDPNWNAQDDEFGYGAAQGSIPYADDIIYGGLGSDFLHGGSGDDAISGAEALPFFYTSALLTMPGVSISGLKATSENGLVIIDLPTLQGVALGEDTLSMRNGVIGAGLWVNPGDVLRFNPVDEDGWKTQNRARAGEFALYDEYDPLRRILVGSADGWSGDLVKDGSGFAFLLNFDPTEGVLRPGEVVPTNGNKTITTPPVYDDGDDVIFGGTGNDWLVGGTGRDTIYGGWGNDLINVDDDHRTNGGRNDQPDTHATYEDRAYGGAGRDILIGNTGGDRLIDWVGEYNSYLVPFAPFGMATVSRTLQPQLPEFLYALSRSQGADGTIVADGNGTAIRNGEPYGELGIVLQKDFAWRDQTGAPADPQAGNIPGGKRDVLRTANFNDGTAQSFVAESGTWSVVQGKYQVAPASTGSNRDAISLFYVDDYIPSYFEIQATLNAVKPTGGLKANAYVIFDYQSPTDFKFAGINVSTNKLEIGQNTGSGWQVLATGVVNGSLRADTDYNVLVSINGTAVTMVINNQMSVSHVFAPRVDSDGMSYNINAGMVGLGSDNGRARIDNVAVQIIPPEITFAATDNFEDGLARLLGGVVGQWAIAEGRFIGTPLAGQSLALAANEIAVGVYSLLRLEAVFSTSGVAGIAFDMYSNSDFKWAAIDASTNRVMIGHYTERGGWVVDAAATRSLGVDDQSLSVTLKGTTVSLMLNGQAVLSHVFNAPVVDGAVGTFARGAAASFDAFSIMTDDPAFASGQAQMDGDTIMAARLGSGVGVVPLDKTEVEALADAAMARWAELLGYRPDVFDELRFVVVDLAGLELARIEGDVIYIDATAAGHGWFVDDTPFGDTEFRVKTSDGLRATAASDAYDKIDLLTVLMHEIGHALGYAHDYAVTGASALMSEALDTGVRYIDFIAPGRLVSSGKAGEQARGSQPVMIDWSALFDTGLDDDAEWVEDDFALDRWQERFVTGLGNSANVKQVKGLRITL